MITLADADVTRLSAIDWSDTAAILDGCTPIYEALRADNGALIAALLDQLPGSPRLAEMCERYDFLDKLVLYDADDGRARIRLHLYRDGYFDRPHPHRWSFFAGLYRGEYVHRIFGRDTDFGEHTDPRTLRPIIERIERPGVPYALDHTTVHTVQARADTISLLVRGPATRDRFLILDAAAGTSFWVSGAANETPAQRVAKQMAPSRLSACIARVRWLLALGDSA